METRIYGNLDTEGIEVISRADRLYVRYDAGAHQVAWREDEISKTELTKIREGQDATTEVLLSLQRRLEASGADPYVSNWRREPA